MAERSWPWTAGRQAGTTISSYCSTFVFRLLNTEITAFYFINCPLGAAECGLLLRGIGPAYAKRLVQTFSDTVFDVIESDPARLRDVEGIGPVRATRITAGWAEQKVVREIMLFLHVHGVDTSRAVRICKTYGAEAVGFVSEDLYRFARDIRGIAKDAIVQVRAGVSFVLVEAMDDGRWRRGRDSPSCPQRTVLHRLF